METRHRDVLQGLHGIKRSSLIQLIVQIVQQGTIDSETSADHCLALAERIPRQSYARLRQELRAVLGEHGVANLRIGLNNPTREQVVRRPSMRLIPTIRRFKPESHAQFQIRPQLHIVLYESSAFYRSPADRSWIGHYGKCGNLASEKARQASERSLPVLRLSQIVIGPDTLHPHARLELMNSVLKSHMIVIGKQIASRCQIAAVVGPSQADLRRAIRRRAATDHNRPNRIAGHPSWHIHRCGSRKEINGARNTES